jgi:poly(A) polymerase
MKEGFLEQLLRFLDTTGFRFLLQSYSALDRYYGMKNQDAVFFLTDAPLDALARLFDRIDFRGTSESDAVVVWEDCRCFFQSIDSLDRLPRRTFTVQNFYYYFGEVSYIDACDMYGDLRSRRLALTGAAIADWTMIADAALLISRYNLSYEPALFSSESRGRAPSIYEQQLLLSHLLSSDSPEKGLALLKETGFIDHYWLELASMTAVPQTKDFHPEGNVWDHVLEAFKYRKKTGSVLSLGILLHDIGKTVANGTKENPYRNHTDHGVFLAQRFLRRLEFPEELIADIVFLIRNHMMPEALPRMPLYRIEKLMISPLFPVLLELYRADLLSTFRGPEKYYEACRIYRSFLKTQGNPFKTLPLSRRIVV